MVHGTWWRTVPGMAGMSVASIVGVMRIWWTRWRTRVRPRAVRLVRETRGWSACMMVGILLSSLVICRGVRSIRTVIPGRASRVTRWRRRVLLMRLLVLMLVHLRVVLRRRTSTLASWGCWGRDG
jgi:hypothetical protein